jgi:hypothetical protein
VLGCATRSDRGIHLFDVATGTGRRTITAPRGYEFVDIEAAGPFVVGEAAERNGRVLIVYDLRTGRELYRVASSQPDTGAYSLQSDGKLVIPALQGSAECGSWYSPAEPVAHPLTFRPCLGQMANDRIVTVGETDPSGDNAGLVLTDLRGSPPVAITSPVDIADGPVFDLTIRTARRGHRSGGRGSTGPPEGTSAIGGDGSLRHPEPGAPSGSISGQAGNIVLSRACARHAGSA